MSPLDHLREKGWCLFPYDETLKEWVDLALPIAKDILKDPMHSKWYRYGNTWFAGVNIFPNSEADASLNGLPLQGKAFDFINETLQPHQSILWDKGQLSVCFPGYPEAMEGESEGQFRFRKNRDAAHVDGLLPFGPNRARFAMEWHRFILGIPLTDHPKEASPFCVWEGSQHIMRDRFKKAFRGLPAQEWPAQDITEIYTQTRKYCFENCRRITLHARPGACYIADPLILHGMAPWDENTPNLIDDHFQYGRMVLYFRPEYHTPVPWLEDLGET